MLASVPRRVKLLIFSLSLNSLAFGYFIIYVTAFFPEVNITPDIVGTLLGVQGGVLALAGIPLGVLSDRRGRKWILILGNAALVPTMLLFALTRSIPLYFLAAILGGFAEAGVLSSWNAIIADQTDLDNRDAAFSLSFITATIFTSIGSALPFVFPVLQRLLAADSYTIHSDALAILGLGNVIPPVLLWVLLRDYKETAGVRERTTGKRNLGVLFRFSGANSMIGLGAGFIIPLIPTWLYAKFAVPDTFSGPLLSLAGITIGLSAVASPVLSRRFGLMKAIVMTAGSSTLFMFSLAFIPNVALAGGIYVVRAALMNMSAPLMDSFLMGVISPDQRGFASAVNAIVWRFPNSISTIFGGIILASGRFDVPFYLATALYVTGISLLYLNFKNVKLKG
jgi:MFS family permease